MTIVLQWIDVLWLALALALVRPDQRPFVAGFFAACMMMMRLQIELMKSLGYSHGLFGLLSLHVFYRGLAAYSFFYAVYLVVACFSPLARGTILMATSILFFFAALVVSMLGMVL